MARKTRRRHYKRSGRWSTNIAEITQNNTLTVSSVGDFNFYSQLIRNPAQTISTVSQKYTVKNIEATFEISAGSITALIENLTAYIVYLPQGMSINNDLITNHPEYVMAYRFIGSPFGDSGGYRNPLRIKTRLARSLNTGDAIILFIKGYSQTNSEQQIEVNGVIRWWTKAN